METCNFDVDVDLLFHEDLTIGKKISLTEKIVTVLNSSAADCPHKIEPHQIQGLDFIHIFPVVQWLVKKAIETRESTGDSVRQQSLAQFGRYFLAQNEPANGDLETAEDPKRMFRQTKSVKNDLEVRVDLTLLEYGRADLVRLGTASSDKQVESDTKSDELADMMTGMAGTDDGGLQKLNSKAVGDILKYQSTNEISKAADQYQKLQEKLEKDKELDNLSVSGLAKSLSHLQQQKSRILEKLSKKNWHLKSPIKSLKKSNRGLNRIDFN